ncbi:MAG TPA: aminoglycoside phosphotransferase family protein [Acidimicrobiales bacterium]|nr:aminoglycoside phosphotransferase family protein [Acidimicrobiales bacterium]
MTWPLAEQVMTTSAVRRLLRAQYPSLADRPLRRVGEGFDNVQWRLGDDLVVRLPRRTLAVPLLANELRWLDEITSEVRLETPAPLFEGRADENFPWPWTIGHWIEGRAGDRVGLNTRARCVEPFVELLRDLHRRAPHDAPHNRVRRGALEDRDEAISERLNLLGGDQGAWRALWDWACTAPSVEMPTWIHGDLHPGNLIFRGGSLVGVIDFGDLCQGDPATDLAGTLLLFPLGATRRAFELYQPEPSMLRRSIGWAMLFSSMFLSLGQTARPSYQRLGEIGRDNVTAWSRAYGPMKSAVQ